MPLGLSLGLRIGQQIGARVIYFTSGALPSGASLTRATTGTYVNSSGNIATAAIDAARFTYDQNTLAALGILIEPAATNLLLYSQSQQTGWAVTASTLANNATVAPDGTSTAASMTDTAVSGGHLANAINVTPTASTTYTYSIWLKKGVNRYAAVQVAGGGLAASIYVSIDFDTAGALSTGLGSPISTSVTAYPSGWYRVAVTFATTTTGGVTCSVYGAGGPAYANRVYTGVPGIAAYLWGAQLETGAVATSYIVTTTATVTRSADVLVLPGSSVGLPNGTYTIRYTFDNASTQDVPTTISGGTWTVPTNLNRAIIKTVSSV